MSAAPILSPAAVAHALGRPEPTPEQATVIGAPLEPGVVIAGAGSGKTETMAARVVWLVANRMVRPEQVLGLTFTRKAALELALRVRARLGQLAGQYLVEPAEVVGESTIATYDSYAGQIVAAHALRLGHEPGAALLTPAAAWLYAQCVVDTYDGPMEVIEAHRDTVVAKVLALHGEMAGHLVSPDDIRRFTTGLLTEAAGVPPARARGSLYYAGVRDVLNRQEQRTALLPLVEEFRARKARDEVVDFADRAELAARLAQAAPDIGAAERSTYRVVLLDEYQDTSHAQLTLLRELFGSGHPVTAVGDPCQSIYAWRGASTGTLNAFGAQFPRADDRPAGRSTLATSFRNAPAILLAANQIAQPLRSAGVDVPELRSFSTEPAGDELHEDDPTGNDAIGHATTGNEPSGQVITALHLSAADEVADVARRAREVWDRAGPRPTVAVLVRSRAQIADLDAALRAVGLPVEISELGGLLSTPEVADVVATLQVLADPGRGDALMRLLTGPRWQIGPRDLRALGRARRSDQAGEPTESTGESAIEPATVPETDLRGEIDEVDTRSIVDVLEDLPIPPAISPDAYHRLTSLAAELRHLRSRTGLPLADLVLEVERISGIGVEVAARRGPAGRAHLDRFRDVAAEFTASGGATSLPAFLAYLQAAAHAERGLSRGDDTGDPEQEDPEGPSDVEVSSSAVQILTAHGAKGLEWDVVFVPGMAEGIFPTQPRGVHAWLSDPGAVPYPLRGDGSSLPVWDVAAATDQKELNTAVERFADSVRESSRLDERRLAYVAVTRARSLLVCSGHRWTPTRKNPCPPSPFLEELRTACEAGAGEVALWVDEPGPDNPYLHDHDHLRWPMDILGDRRAQIADGAQLVQAATDLEKVAAAAGVGAAEVEAGEQEWSAEIDALLTERQRSREPNPVTVELPETLSVTALVALRADHEAFARRLRRPVPRRPEPAARRGTRFHAWLEERWGAPHLLDVDELPGSADSGTVPEADIADLQQAFLSSAWARRQPVEIEAPFEVPLGDQVIRGRVDAVFATPDGGVEVVDWKTGPPPADPESEHVRAIQLAAYRVAFARLYQRPLQSVTAAFHHVREQRTLRPADLLDEDALRQLIDSVPPVEQISSLGRHTSG